MARLFQDVRYALRLLTRTPGFAAVAVLTLALGIGANTAIFTVVNALLIRPLPYRHAERLVMVWQDLRARGGPADEWATPGNYADWRKEKAIFDEVAVISGWRPTLTGGAEPEPIPGEQVSHEYFSVLGIDPLLGRTFAASDDVPNAPRVAVISHALWERRFGGDRSLIGQSIPLSGESHEIVGCHSGGVPADRQRRSRNLAALAHQYGHAVTRRDCAARGRAPPRWPSARASPGRGRHSGDAARERFSRSSTKRRASTSHRSINASSATSSRDCWRCSARLASCC